MTYKERITLLERELENINEEQFSNLIHKNFSSLEMHIWGSINNYLEDLSFSRRSELFVCIMRDLGNEINRKIFVLNYKAEEEMRYENNLGS